MFGQIEFTLLNGKNYLVAPNPRNYAKVDRIQSSEQTGISITTRKYTYEWAKNAKFKILAAVAGSD